MLDPGTNLPSNHVFFPDHIGRINDSYGSWQTLGAHLGAERKLLDDGDDSGVCSPPLWRSTSPTSSPQHRKNHYRSLSPSSRTQAIARGQKELMEMVSRMPESCYELSLKDLVEHPMIHHEAKQESFREDQKNVKKSDDKGGGGGVLKKNHEKKQMMKRSGSVDNDRFLLKMVFPLSLGSKKHSSKKKNDSLSNNSSKITPKSPACNGSDKGAVDKDWWKKRCPSESESHESSINSGSAKSTASSSSNSSNNSNSQGSGGCWPFMRTKKIKKVE